MKRKEKVTCLCGGIEATHGKGKKKKKITKQKRRSKGQRQTHVGESGCQPLKGKKNK